MKVSPKNQALIYFTASTIVLASVVLASLYFSGNQAIGHFFNDTLPHFFRGYGDKIAFGVAGALGVGVVGFTAYRYHMHRKSRWYHHNVFHKHA